jgi:hypothetical protein
MSNKSGHKKLTLNSETIRTLSGAELGDINGGTIGAVFMASVRFCKYTDKAVKATIAVGKAVKWASDHAPAGDPENPPSVVGATA